jgi:transcriptional regulator with XRE-family HTH domain
MTPLRKIVARNLKTLRDARGMGQVELAVIAGVDRSYISDIEAGKYGVSIDKIDSLAEALGVAPWEMLHPLTATNIGKAVPPDRTDRSGPGI